MHLRADGESARPMRLVHIPVDPRQDGKAGTYLLVDSHNKHALDSADLQALLEILPIGLALVDRDGRFLTMNRAFRMAAGIKGQRCRPIPATSSSRKTRRRSPMPCAATPAGRRCRATSRFDWRATEAEPVALTVAGLRGLGDAAVLLLLKDNSEEAKLKRQIAQATKMQVVGQLAGGVAHDFNNILTAIIGHCDLMLMRHTPGDSDYDDIQQIKSNSNRAAGPDPPVAGLFAPANAAPAGAAAAGRRVGGLASAEAPARRDGRAGGQARPRPRPGAGRSGPARAGDHQSRGQCARRHGDRRAGGR